MCLLYMYISLLHVSSLPLLFPSHPLPLLLPSLPPLSLSSPPSLVITQSGRVYSPEG